ncbi:glutamate decarboxylase B [Escherichia coli]|nr:glutamate decarboxylase B [Escherichia coli]
MDQKLLTDFRSELLDSRFGAKALSTIAVSYQFPLPLIADVFSLHIPTVVFYTTHTRLSNHAPSHSYCSLVHCTLT